MTDNPGIKNDPAAPAAYRYGEALPEDSRLLEELLKATEVQQLFESYYNLIKIPVAIIDLKGNVLLSSRWQRICTQFHRVQPDTCAICVESDTKIAQQLTEGKHYAIFPCKNGLTDCASPIIMDGKHVANLFIGQFMTRQPDEAWFREQASKYGFPLEDYLAAAREVPVVDEGKIPVILDLLARMTRVITTLSADRKRAVEAHAHLQSAETRFRVLSESSLAPVYMLQDGVFSYTNPAFENLFGYGPGELLGQPPQTCIAPEDHALVAEGIRAEMAGEIKTRRYEVRGLKKSGERLDIVILAAIAELGSRRVIIGSLLDITESKRAAKELAETQALMGAIIESTQDFIWTVNPDDFAIVTSNTAFGEYFRTKRGMKDLSGKRPQDLFPDQRFIDWWHNAFNSALRDGHYSAEYGTYAAGMILLLDINLLKKDGKPLVLSVFGKNITELKQTQDKYRALFDSAQDGIALADIETGELLDCNAALCALVEREKAELIGQSQTILHPPRGAAGALPDTFNKHVEEKTDTPLENVLLAKSGKLTSVEIRVSKFTLGGRRLILGLFRDMTERKRAEDELKHNNRELVLAAERLAVAAQAARFGVWDWDIPRNELSWDDAMYGLYGVRREDFSGAYEAWAKHIHPEDKARTEADIQAALRGEREYAPEFRVVRPDGSVRYLKADSRTIRGQDGKPLRMVGTNIDITERKQAEAELRDSKSVVDSVVENVPLMVFLKEAKELRFVIFNRAGEELLGYERKALLGKNNLDLFPPEQAAQFMAKDREVLDGEAGFLDIPEETISTAKKGDRVLHTRKVCIRGSDGTTKYLLGIAEDITERKFAEEKLRDNELKYRALFEKADDAILLFTDNEWVDCNKAAERVFGCARADIIGQHPKKFSPPTQPDGRNSTEESIRLITLAYEGAPQSFEWTHCRLDGALFPAEVSLNRVDLGGKPHMQAIVRDIAKRKESENRQALYLSVLKRLGDGEASDSLISDIINYIGETLDIQAVGIRIERDGDFPFMATRGYSPEFVEKERTLCKNNPEGGIVRDAAGNVTLECLCGAVIRGTLPGTLPIVTKGGSLWLNSTSALTPEDVGAVTPHLMGFRGRCVDVGFESLALIPLRSKDKVIGLLHLADHRKNRLSLELVEFLEGLGSSVAIVIDRKEAEEAKAKLEEQIRQSQKMESVGRLAGGVAHDFNNLLTAMSGYGSMLLRDFDENDPRRGDLLEMMGAAERGAALTKQLLAFSRKQVLNPVVLDLNSSVESTLKMLKRMIGEDITLQTDLAPAPCLIMTDSGQLGQVIMNLAVNARDAMPQGGTLRISTRAVNMPDSFFASNPGLKAGPLIALVVADTGCGMSEDVQQRIFEPFFTTKEKGKGTGLGLPTVYGIVTQSGGIVHLDSAPGKGTVFTLYFSQSSEPQTGAEGKAAGRGCREGLRGRGEKVLLVEDDEALRRLGERVLSEAGYDVSTALNGRDALACLERLGGPVNLVISDVIMPSMNGREMVKEIRRRGLAARVLFVSGYNEEAVDNQVAEPGVGFLAKPFAPDVLLCKVREVLDSV